MKNPTPMTFDLRSLLVGAALVGTLFLGYSFRPEPSSERYTYRQFSTIESIVPGGLGRSRIILSDANAQAIEKDLLNFYSMVGINFKNIANNDRLIVETINNYITEGWELHTVTTGVQSPAGGPDGGSGNGIFITRYLFRKPI